MTTLLLRIELLHFLRDRRVVLFGIAVLLIVCTAALDGWARAAAARADRAAASTVDREIWVEQGPNNPHGAAHFARYAFRSVSPLAAFDPGLSDYGGAAVWMEAHYQNPAALRRSEDMGTEAPWPAVDPAWAIRVLGGLFLAVLLFPAIAGERERGTLRALAAQGVSASAIFAGKAGAAFVPVALFGGGLLCALLFSGANVFDVPLEPLRVLALALAYCLGLGAFAALVLALSARAADRGSALAVAGGAWVVLALALPGAAGSFATAVHPTPTPREFNTRLQLEAQSPFWVGDAREGAIAAYERQVLERYGADSFEALGFDRDAMELQAHETFANAVYDRIYGDLEDIHQAQDALDRGIALLSPLHLLQRISAGLAGSDLLAQTRFAQDAEAHRRRMIEQLNVHMMEEAGGTGFAYAADRSLWAAIEDFDGSPPSLAEVTRHYALEWLALLLWATGALALARREIRRALRDAVVA